MENGNFHMVTSHLLDNNKIFFVSLRVQNNRFITVPIKADNRDVSLAVLAL
jgi:hypothetical protein